VRNRLLYLLPLGVFVVLAIYFAVGLTKDPRLLPSVLIDTPVPDDLDLAPIRGRDRGLKAADLKGDVTLVNIFGSWCVACRVEHPFLMQLARRKLVPIHGIDWKEETPDAGPAWLAKFGDPYTLIGDDPNSRAAIAFGVTGAPESFIVDRQGVIRYKHIGPISPEAWEKTLWPLIQELRKR
jgi:cytochrome c biogenesis protein CcmG/thiol:disulfide interchange protein DsbE